MDHAPVASSKVASVDCDENTSALKVAGLRADLGSSGSAESAPITPFREGRKWVESGVERGASVNAKVAA
jgi:hypothetical protein